MFGWAIFMPIGVMVARYLRQYDPIWFYAHTTIQSLGFILGFAGVISGLVLNNRLQNNVNRHKGIGIFILVLGCLQVCHFYTIYILVKQLNFYVLSLTIRAVKFGPRLNDLSNPSKVGMVIDPPKVGMVIDMIRQFIKLSSS